MNIKHTQIYILHSGVYSKIPYKDTFKNALKCIVLHVEINHKGKLTQDQSIYGTKDSRSTFPYGLDYWEHQSISGLPTRLQYELC